MTAHVPGTDALAERAARGVTELKEHDVGWLSLEGLDFGPAPAFEALCRLIETDSTIIWLSLRACNLNTDALARFVTSFRRNPSINFLDIRCGGPQTHSCLDCHCGVTLRLWWSGTASTTCRLQLHWPPYSNATQAWLKLSTQTPDSRLPTRNG